MDIMLDIALAMISEIKDEVRLWITAEAKGLASIVVELESE
jgi:hypothetical protein